MRREHLLSAASALALVVVTGCSPKAGHVRFSHPVHKAEVGREPPAAPGAPTILFDDAAPDDTARARAARTRIAEAAAEFVGSREVSFAGQRYRADCSGTARGIYARAGFPLGGQPLSRGENDVSVLYRYVEENGSLRKSNPLPGDLVFFDNSYDRDGNGQLDDRLSHIGVVEKVLDDGTVVFVHRVGRGILRYRMNLEKASLRKDPATGARLNHYLRAKSNAGPAATTAELFVGYGTVVVSDPPSGLFAAR